MAMASKELLRKKRGGMQYPSTTQAEAAHKMLQHANEVRHVMHTHTHKSQCVSRSTHDARMHVSNGSIIRV